MRLMDEVPRRWLPSPPQVVVTTGSRAAAAPRPRAGSDRSADSFGWKGHRGEHRPLGAIGIERGDFHDQFRLSYLHRIPCGVNQRVQVSRARSVVEENFGPGSAWAIVRADGILPGHVYDRFDESIHRNASSPPPTSWPRRCRTCPAFIHSRVICLTEPPLRALILVNRKGRSLMVPDRL
jgi:hypothetical protein